MLARTCKYLRYDDRNGRLNYTYPANYRLLKIAEQEGLLHPRDNCTRRRGDYNALRESER
jgi:hypothetical protein